MYVGQQIVIAPNNLLSETTTITVINSSTSFTVSTLVNAYVLGIAVRGVVLYASNIITQLIGRLTTNIPSTAIANVVTQIESSLLGNGPDLWDVVAVDERMSSLIRRLALRDRYRVWVDRYTRVLVYERDNPTNTWAIDASDVQVTRDGSGVENSVYGIYNADQHFPARVAAVDNAISQTHFGYERRGVLDTNTGQSSTATARATAEVAIRGNPPPRVDFKFKRFFTEAGNAIDGELPRNGDLIKTRNFPVTLGSAVDQTRFYVLRRTELAGQRGTPGITVSIETSRPSASVQRTLASLNVRFLDQVQGVEPKQS